MLALYPERSERGACYNIIYRPAPFSFPKLLPYFSHFPNCSLILPRPLEGGTTQPLPSQGRKLLIYKTSLVLHSSLTWERFPFFAQIQFRWWEENYAGKVGKALPFLCILLLCIFP